MANIIAARFETQVAADRAIDALKASGCASGDITSFYLNPQGQHSTYPIGGDAHHDEGAKHAGKTAAAGATVGGVAGLAIGTAAAMAAEPGFTAVAAVAGAGVGAYVGSLAGAMSGTESGDPSKASVEEPVEREAGIMVAVRVADASREDGVIRTLRGQGAEGLERATGEWRDGTWADFDPRRSPQPIR